MFERLRKNKEYQKAASYFGLFAFAIVAVFGNPSNVSAQDIPVVEGYATFMNPTPDISTAKWRFDHGQISKECQEYPYHAAYRDVESMGKFRRVKALSTGREVIVCTTDASGHIQRAGWGVDISMSAYNYLFKDAEGNIIKYQDEEGNYLGPPTSVVVYEMEYSKNVYEGETYVDTKQIQEQGQESIFYVEACVYSEEVDKCVPTTEYEGDQSRVLQTNTSPVQSTPDITIVTEVTPTSIYQKENDTVFPNTQNSLSEREFRDIPMKCAYVPNEPGSNELHEVCVPDLPADEFIYNPAQQ